MFATLTSLLAVSAWAILATVVVVARDGYRQVPYRADLVRRAD